MNAPEKQGEDAYLEHLRQRVRELATLSLDKRNFHFAEGFDDLAVAIVRLTPEDLYMLDYCDRGELEVAMYEAYREKVNREVREEWNQQNKSSDDREALRNFIRLHPRDRLVQYIGNKLNVLHLTRQLREVGVEVPPPSS